MERQNNKTFLGQGAVRCIPSPEPFTDSTLEVLQRLIESREMRCRQYSIGAPSNNAGPSGAAKATPPWAATQTKSTYKQGDPRVTISVTNNTGKDLEFLWVDGNGKEAQPPGVIRAGAEKHPMGTTYPGSLYRFKLDGKLLHTWVIQKDQTHLKIGSPSNNAASSGAAKATPPWAATQTKSTYKQGDPRVTISVTNNTGKDLEFLWVDGNGKEAQPPGVIRAGAKNHQMGTTYPGNLYRFKLNGKLLHSWVIQKDQTHLIIE